ncbi:MAG: hypothetical protein Tsb0010_10670 [Parvularculaceae bacterium]
MKKLLATTVAIAALGTGAALAGPTAPVDLFLTPTPFADVTNPGDPGVSSSQGRLSITVDGTDGSPSTAFARTTTLGPDIIGGERDVTFTNPGSTPEAGLGASTLFIGIDPIAMDAVLRISSDDGTSSTGTLIYDGSSGAAGEVNIDNSAAGDVDGADNIELVNTTGLGGLDFSVFDAFLFEIQNADQGLTATVSIWDTLGGFASVNLTVPQVGGMGGFPSPLLAPIPFDVFLGLPVAIPPGFTVNSVTADAGFDFSSLGAIAFGIDTVNDADLRLGLIVAAPEPSTLAIFGAGLLGAGLMASRRRRKGKKA